VYMYRFYPEFFQKYVRPFVSKAWAKRSVR